MTARHLPRRRSRLARRLGRFDVDRFAFTRQGALAAARVAEAPHLSVRPLAWLVAGSAALGFGIALLLRAGFGAPPYDVLLSGVAGSLGVSHGQAGWLIGATFMLIARVLGRQPRLDTLLFVLCNGLMIDLASALIDSPDALALRLTLVPVGIGAVGSGLALVLHGGATGGPFDMTVRAIADRGLDPSRVRTAIELTVLVVGIGVGGAFGPATIVFALTIALALRIAEFGIAWCVRRFDRRVPAATRLRAAGSSSVR